MRACSWLSGEVANAQESSIVIGIPPGCPHDLCACDVVMERPNANAQPPGPPPATLNLEKPEWPPRSAVAIGSARSQLGEHRLHSRSTVVRTHGKHIHALPLSRPLAVGTRTPRS